MKQLLILLLAGITMNCAWAQEPDPFFFEETWYLSELTYEGVEYEIPSNSEVEFVTMQFFPGVAPYSFQSDVCNALLGFVDINDVDDTMVFTEVIQTLITCNLPVNDAFEFPYFDFFMSADGETLDFFVTFIDAKPKPPLYEIEIFKASGDRVKYNSYPPLSTDEFNEPELTIYPNPTSSSLLWANSAEPIERATLLSLDGRTLKEVKVEGDQIDVSFLPAGMYFLQLNSGSKTTIKRFIKH